MTVEYCILRAFNITILSKMLFQMTPDGWEQTEAPQKRLFGLYWKMKVKREFKNG